MAMLLRFVRLSSSKSNILTKLFRSSTYLETANSPIILSNNLRVTYRYFVSENVQTVAQPHSTSGGGFHESGIEQQQERLDRAFYKMDNDVRKTGRIAMNHVKEIFNEMKAIGMASSTQSLLVIRCCGALLPDERVKDRIDLVEDIWKTLQSFNTRLDVSHYNALLKIYLENEHRFSAIDFLSNMEAKGIVANRVTYQRLLGHYCQQGDMDGASKILDFMKEKDLPINENVFNSLVQGHTRSNDFKSARDILDVMRNAKLDPSADTYTYLIRGYAEKGDIDSIREIIKEVESADIHLLDRDYMDILISLCSSGHSEHADEIISKMRKSIGYVQDSINTIYQLLNAEQDEVAFKILLSMPKPISTKQQVTPIGQFFIRHMVKCGRPIETILDVCERLRELSMNNVGVLRAAEISLYFEKFDYAVAFLKVMKDQDQPIRPHYFWPILASYKKQSNKSGIFDILKLMIDLNCPADSDTFDTYVFAADAFFDPFVIIEKLKEIGYPIGIIVDSLVGCSIMEKKLDAAIKIVRDHPFVRLTVNGQLIRQLAAGCRESKDFESSAELLKKFDDSREPHHRIDSVGNFVLSYLKDGINSQYDLETLLVALKSRDLKISSASSELLQDFVSQNMTADAQITQLFDEMTSTSFSGIAGEDDDGYIPHPREMDIDQLTNHYLELKSKGMNVRGVLRRLLLQYSRIRDLENTIKIHEELKAMDVVYTPGMYANLMAVNVAHDKLDEALEFKAKMYQCDPSFNVDIHKLINLSILLVNNNRIEEALQLLQNKPLNVDGLRNSPYTVEKNVWRLLNAVASQGDVDAVNSFFDIVVKNEYIVPTNFTIGPTVKVHLIKGDLEGALKQFEYCCITYSCTPLKNEIFKGFIESEDAEKLQKVVDLSIKVHGEMNTMYDLAFAFLECNRVRQARKIFETPGMRALHNRLDRKCEQYLFDDKVDELEAIILVTQNVFGIDRDRLYHYLLRAYAKRDDVDKALGVWTVLQDENIQPSDDTLIFLADFLKKHNRSVPFAVPTIRPTLKLEEEKQTSGNKLQSMMKQSKDILLQKFLVAVADLDVDKAMQLKKEIDDSGRKFNSVDYLLLLLKNNRMDEVIKVATTSKSNRYLSVVLRHLAAAGELVAIESISESLTNADKEAVRLEHYKMTAMIFCGRHMEFLESIENSTPKREQFPTGSAIIHLLTSHPELVDRLEKLLDVCEQNDVHVLQNMMFIYHFISGDFEKAERVFQSTPRFKDKLLYLHIVKHAKTQMDDSLLLRLMETVKKTDVRPKGMGIIFSALIDIYRCKGNLDAAAAVVEEATLKEGISISDLSRATLYRLQTSLVNEGKPVKFDLPVSTGATLDDVHSDDEH